ncbi:phage protein NinX family protein [Serratia sp. CY47279]|uniref:phage protein NinX family protein n=1 Tax=Serratia sp. CY47279 TaxID=3383624 RepID=UPI003FA0F242
MTDYSKMSDFEIDKAVAEITGDSKPTVEEWGISRIIPDYCNNPADAWPIITDMRPNIIPERSKSGKWSIGVNIGKTLHEIDRKENNFTYVDANLLRGCMIVFLMMKDAEKC